MLQHVFILGGFRTFIGVRNKMYRNVPAEALGAAVLRRVAAVYCPDPEEIDLILGGNACAGGGNVTRLAALSAGLPASVPAVTTDLQCASALDCVASAAARIECGLADLVIAGGTESASTQPYREWNPNHPDCPEDPAARRYMTACFVPGKFGESVMLEGAERTAQADHITKEEMDPFILRSHRLAAEAAGRGVLADLCVDARPEPDRCARDEGIRPNMSQRFLDRLPYLLPGGSLLTAGNACLMNDGAAFAALCSDRYAKAHGLHPRFSFRSAASVGADPDFSPRTAVLATEKLLASTELRAEDISAFEVNEAFALIDVLFQRAFPGTLSRCSVYGGALAYGHPYGASGGILLMHLMRALSERNGRYGIASIAAAGGVGEAILIENHNL